MKYFFSLAVSLLVHGCLLFELISIKGDKNAVTHFSHKINLITVQETHHNRKQHPILKAGAKESNSTHSKKSISEPSKHKKNYGQDTLIAMYSQSVRRIINKLKYYPQMQKELGLEGKVVIKLNILATGEIEKFEIIEHHTHFDSVVKKLIKSIKTFDAFPESLKLTKLSFTIPIQFRLENS